MPTREMPQFPENGSIYGRFSLISAIFEAVAALQTLPLKRVVRRAVSLSPSLLRVLQLHQLPPSHAATPLCRHRCLKYGLKREAKASKGFDPIMCLLVEILFNQEQNESKVASLSVQREHTGRGY